MKSLNSLLQKIKKLNLEEKIDLEEVKKAYNFSENAHKWQFRESWEPYIIHPTEVAKIVLDLKPETETIVAALLHDVVEDTIFSIDEIRKIFWEVVWDLVWGLTKVSKIDLSKSDRKVESLRKMFISMAKDLRVVFIKLADRYHNIQTLWFTSKEKQKRVAQETMDIYVPVAERLGIYKIKTPLEDLCFEILNNKDFDIIKNQIWKLWEDFMKESEKRISHVIKWENFKDFEISWRIKWKYSIFKKISGKKIDNISEIYDIFAIRVIVDSVEDCYRILWIIHKYYRPLWHRFKDYIATPKLNGYRSLHTVVIWLWQEFNWEMRPVEIQIRTKAMHFESEYWAASHWSYKEWLKRDNQSRFIKNLIDLEEEIEDNDEFLRNIHIDVLNERIFVLTPKWDIKDLPKWATALDFAFLIHADIWKKCIWANVNWKNVALNSILHNWDTIKVTTRNDGKPNPWWLRFLKTSKAKHEIKKWLSEQNRDILIDDWLKLLNSSLLKLWKEKLDKDYSILKNFNWKKINKTEREDIIEQVWRWSVTVIDIIKKVLWHDDLFKKLDWKNKEDKKNNKNWKIDKINKIDDLNWNEKSKLDSKSKWVYFKWWGWENYKLMESCCDPKEWDEIIWYIWRWSSIWIHKKDCAFIKSADYKRFIKWFWEWWPVEYSADLELKLEFVVKDFYKIFELFEMKWLSISKILYEENLNPNFQILNIWVNFTDLNNFSLLIEKIDELDFIHEVSVNNLSS